MIENAPIFKRSWCYSRFLIHFSIRKKLPILLFKDSSSTVKAGNFNSLNPDLLTLYRRPNPIKIWQTYGVPPTTTLYPRSTYDLLVYWFLWPLRLVWLSVFCLYKEVYLQIFKCVSFWLHGCCGGGEGWPVNQVNHTSWKAVVTPTDCP